jgi:hypothetical protein
MTWRTFLQARWPALVAADFFTTEVWTGRGLVTYYVAFLLDVQSRRIQVIGCTPYPNEAFVIQCLRHATGETGLLSDGRLLLCDRDPRWSRAVEQWLGAAGVRIVRTPPSAAGDWRRSPSSARRRDSQLLLPVSGVGRWIRAWDRTVSRPPSCQVRA